MAQANNLGLKATTNSANHWTTKDDAIIRQYYPLDGKNCYKRIAGSTPATIVGRASFLKIKNHGCRNHPQCILCIETQEIFQNISMAAQKYSITDSGATRYFKGERQYWGQLPDGTKLHWKYVE